MKKNPKTHALKVHVL